MSSQSVSSVRSGSKVNTAQLVWFVGVILVLAAAVYLRFNNLEMNPGWYSDEGSDLDIARHLAQGHWQYFALGGTPLVAGRFPLFHILLVLAFQVWGYDIAAARMLVAVFSVGTIVLLFLAVREMLGKWTALLSALMLAIMPNSLLYSRIAFAYNVQAFFLVLCWYTLWKFVNTRRAGWLVGASLAAAAGYMVALTGLPLVACVALVVLLMRPRQLLWSVPLMLAPGVIFLGTLYFSSAGALQQDLTLTLGRTSDSVLAQFFNLVSNYVLWFDWTFWVVLGVVGLFLISNRSARWLTLLIFFAVLFNVMRAFPGAGDLNLHRYLGVLPLLAVGAAQFLVSGFTHMRGMISRDAEALPLPESLKRFNTKRVRDGLVYAAVGVLLVLPLLWLTLWDAYLVSAPTSPRVTRLDFVSVTNPPDAREITDWVNAQASAEDVVLASPTIAWLLNGRTADFQQALAAEGIVTDNYGAGLPPERFLYDVRFENAKYVVVDRLWRGWASERMPPLADYMNTIGNWDVVKQQGEFTVYRNPAR